MKISINKNLKEIIEEIVSENLSESEWRKRESGDWFQKKTIVGGYDINENAFCFSYYDENNKEFWFQLTTQEIEDIYKGKKNSFEARDAE